MIDASMAPLDAAAEYAARGWRVLPIKPNEKRPPMAEWQKAATTEADVIDAWWSGLYRGHGIGVATGRGSGIFVLDVDVAGEKAGDQTLDEYVQMYGQLPATPTAVTPSGGVHYYFALPDGVEIRNDAGSRLGHGLDIRGEGGQVVAPPTRRGGDCYAWLEGTYELEPAEAPAWLIERVASDPITRIAESPNERLSNNLMDRNGAVQSAVSGEDGPAQRYNQRTTWAELLLADGWTLTTQAADGEQGWTRPGKAQREGISATVGHGGGDQLTVFTSSIPWLPMGSYSRFGYYACRFHEGDRSAAAMTLRMEDYAGVEAFLDNLPVIEPGAEPIQPDAILPPQNRSELAHIVDWSTFWDLDHSDEEWLAYPLIPKGRAIALYAPAKAGKSTVVLAVAAALATGRPILGHRRAEPCNVLYLDYEMTQADLQERLYELGYGPEDDLSRLKYALLPSLPPLDTREGAIAVLELCDEHEVEAVIVDTFGRAVEGEEDHADTVRAFYRHTGLALKARKITYLRTDHSGKDVSKGMRGSSAKNDDVDLVWKLTRRDTKDGGGVQLERTHSRISWVPEKLTIARVETQAGFDYVLDASERSYPDGTARDMELLVSAGVGFSTSQNKAREFLKAMGIKMGDKRLRPALQMLKDLDPTKSLPTASDAPDEGGTRPASEVASDAVAPNRDAADAPALSRANARDAAETQRDATDQPPSGRGASPVGGRGVQADPEAVLEDLDESDPMNLV